MKLLCDPQPSLTMPYLLAPPLSLPPPDPAPLVESLTPPLELAEPWLGLLDGMVLSADYGGWYCVYCLSVAQAGGAGVGRARLQLIAEVQDSHNAPNSWSDNTRQQPSGLASHSSCWCRGHVSSPWYLTLGTHEVSGITRTRLLKLAILSPTPSPRGFRHLP